MDISRIDINSIETFGLIYTNAKVIFGVEPIAASAKMQKKIRKWIEKIDISVKTYSTEVMQCVGKEVCNEKFFEFLKACHDQIQLNGTYKKQTFDQVSTGLTEEARSAIWALLEYGVHCGNIRKVGTDAQIDVDYSAGYDRILTLVNASGIPKGTIDCLSFENGALMKQKGEYSLLGEAENYEEDRSTPFVIRFTDAKVDINLFRADV